MCWLPSPAPTFLPFFVACTAECGPRTCPDWYAAGLMTGSGWFDSSHGHQVFHTSFPRPWPFGWGPSFCPAVMTMLCPRPRCEWDAYPKTGIHLCLRVVCPYRWMTRAILLRRIDRLKRIQPRTAQQEQELGEARRTWEEDLGNGL